MSDDDATARAHARVGDVLNDKWTLERLLGIGGMGAVYAGLHRNGARAAVKVLHHYLASHEDVRARFLREGYAANRVEHPGVVKVLDDDTVVGGPDDGTAYLVMELLEGESLEARANSGFRVTERDFLAVADEVLDVLQVAHANGVVHRDIKPDNLFIARDADGRKHIKVLDFGLARLLEGQRTTVHGVALGTPSFMAPEQAAGRNDEIDGRTDLFGLAASGFRLVTGRRVHEGVNSVDLVVRMAKLPAPRIRTVAPEVSEAFARVLDRALEFRREDRYESAAAMRADVLGALAALDASLCPTTLPSPTAPEKSVELSTSDIEPAPPAEPLRESPPDSPPDSPQGGAAAHPTPPEPAERAAAAPRRRAHLALAGLAALAVGASVAYVGDWFSASSPPPASASVRSTPASSLSATTDDDARDASLEATVDGEVASSAGKDGSIPRPRRMPGKRPMPWKPFKRPKR